MASIFRSCKRSCNPENVVDSQITNLILTRFTGRVFFCRGFDLVSKFLFLSYRDGTFFWTALDTAVMTKFLFSQCLVALPPLARSARAM